MKKEKKKEFKCYPIQRKSLRNLGQSTKGLPRLKSEICILDWAFIPFIFPILPPFFISVCSLYIYILHFTYQVGPQWYCQYRSKLKLFGAMMSVVIYLHQVNYSLEYSKCVVVVYNI